MYIFFLINFPQARHLQSKKMSFLLKFWLKWYFVGILPVRSTHLWEKGRIGAGSGSGSLPLTNGSGSGRPKNMRILRFRIWAGLIWPEAKWVCWLLGTRYRQFLALLSLFYGIKIQKDMKKPFSQMESFPYSCRAALLDCEGEGGWGGEGVGGEGGLRGGGGVPNSLVSGVKGKYLPPHWT